jgi:hypothetical protein
MQESDVRATRRNEVLGSFGAVGMATTIACQFCDVWQTGLASVPAAPALTGDKIGVQLFSAVFALMTTMTLLRSGVRVNFAGGWVALHRRCVLRWDNCLLGLVPHVLSLELWSRAVGDRVRCDG